MGLIMFVHYYGSVVKCSAVAQATTVEVKVETLDQVVNAVCTL